MFTMCYVHMADHEWSDKFNLFDVAREDVFDKYPDLDDLVVTVYEHGGWFLAFIRDGTIVDTANDAARMSEKAREFWQRTRGAKWAHLPSIRRGERENQDRPSDRGRDPGSPEVGPGRLGQVERPNAVLGP